MDKSDKIEKIVTECDCGCGILKINKFENFTDEELKEMDIDKDKQYDYSFSFLIDSFSSKQEGIFKTIKNRIKLIWYIIKGKEYLLHDFIFNQKQMEELTKDLQNLIK